MTIFDAIQSHKKNKITKSIGFLNSIVYKNNNGLAHNPHGKARKNSILLSSLDGYYLNGRQHNIVGRSTETSYFINGHIIRWN